MQRVYLTCVFAILFLALFRGASFHVLYIVEWYFELRLTYDQYLQIEDYILLPTFLGLLIGGVGAWKFFAVTRCAEDTL